MAPHVGFDTEYIRDKARKDLLYLLEGVSRPRPLQIQIPPPQIRPPRSHPLVPVVLDFGVCIQPLLPGIN